MSTLAINRLETLTGQELLPAAVRVTFSGTTGAILDSAGVASVTRHTTGQYTVNFSRPFANTAFSVAAFGNNDSGPYSYGTEMGSYGTRSTASVRVAMLYQRPALDFDFKDPSAVSVVVHGKVIL